MCPTANSRVPLANFGVRQGANEKIVVHRKLLVTVLVYVTVVYVRSYSQACNEFFNMLKICPRINCCRRQSKLHRMSSYMVVHGRTMVVPVRTASYVSFVQRADKLAEKKPRDF